MYEIFEKLCQQRGITPYRFCKDAGISTSTISTWKTSGNKCGTKLQKAICEYFDISVDYLMTGKIPEPKQGYYLNDETAAIAQEIFENKELRMLFDASRNATPEDLLTVRDMMLALKRKERGEDD